MLTDTDPAEARPQAAAIAVTAAAGKKIRPRLIGRWEGFTALLSLFLKWSLALLFIYAGALKLKDPRAFAQAIGQYGLVPEAIIPVLALGLPVLEVLAGLGLLVNIRCSLGAILLMLLMFIGILGYAIAADLDIDCGCFTAADLAARSSVKAAFFQDLGFLAAALFLRWRRRVRGRGPVGRGQGLVISDQ
ncbi:MAG: DoxX family membrane protein [Deltaproteobacteria bacterium]|nr:MAG: DoxX family membrane protein [Deltaproteobacteria bacterium]